MKHLRLHRYFQDAVRTLGMLTVVGQDDPYFYTVERPWLNNKEKVSCIPDGTYDLVPHNGPIFKDVYRLWQDFDKKRDVEGRSGILIHVGNTDLDGVGCIIIGQHQANVLDRRDGRMKKGVMNSTLAMNRLRNLLGEDRHKITIFGGTTNWK